jgi:superfamily II DNA or RNA helicase
MIEENSPRTIWQKSVISKWVANGAKGYTEICTGAGKSYIGVLAIQLCNQRHPDKKINIVVPSIVLADAWTDEKKGHIKLHGLKNVEVFVINTYVKSQHDCALLIIDEVQHAAGEKAKTFNKVIELTKFNWLLCLTATLEDNHKTFLHGYGVKLIEKFTAQQGVDAGWLSPYKVLCVPIELDAEDREKYEIINKNYNKYGSPFYRGAFIDFNIAMGCLSKGSILTNYAQEIDWDEKQLQIMALQWNNAMRKRKEFLYHVESKINAAIVITKELRMQTILFGQSIAGADKIAESLGDECVEYHSKMTKTQAKLNLKRLRDGRTKVKYISSAKGLEEGFDLPNLQLGVTWSRTSKTLGAVQKLGRILRFHPGKIAYFIELYVPDTQDEKWLKSSLRNQKNVLYLKSIDQLYSIIENDKARIEDGTINV